MLGDDKARLYEKGASAVNRDNAKYNAGKHKRQRRGFFKIVYGQKVFVFYPSRFWPSYTGLSSSGILSLVNNGIIVMYEKSNVKIATRGELELIRAITLKHEVTKRANALNNPEFIAEMRSSMNILRTLMDTVKNGGEPICTNKMYKDCMHFNLTDRNIRRP